LWWMSRLRSISSMSAVPVLAHQAAQYGRNRRRRQPGRTV
jgi:hypothetical protein